MNKITRLMTVCAALLLIVPAASADWSDNFDSYALNSGLHGQGGWEGWEGSAAADGFVTDVQAYSAPHSLACIPTTDIVQGFTETSGDWIMTGYCYIPSGSEGDQYFIMLNSYWPNTNDWSVQVKFDGSGGTVTDYYSSSVATMIYDQWVQIRVEIYLDINAYDLYYNDTFLASNAWQSTGVNEIAALDIFADPTSNPTTIFWDDFTLIGVGALEHTTWGHIKTVMQ